MGAGLEDLVADGYRRIGVEIAAPGKSVGKGLTQKSAEEIGLHPGIAVATPLIDAHSGTVGRSILMLVHHSTVGNLLIKTH